MVLESRGPRLRKQGRGDGARPTRWRVDGGIAPRERLPDCSREPPASQQRVGCLKSGSRPAPRVQHSTAPPCYLATRQKSMRIRPQAG
jgi:hypothetical protein